MSKGSKINVGSIEEDVEILNKFANMTFLYGNRVSLNKKNLLEVLDHAIYYMMNIIIS